MGKRVVINASAAKHGGAKTIVDSFMGDMDTAKSGDVFLLIAPKKPEKLKEGVQFVQRETSGLGTLLFSCIGILLICLKFRASHCVSFNNVNLILPLCKRITYFHQAKVFTEKSMRFRVMAFAIKLLRGSTVIVQSPLIASMFEQYFSKHFQILVKWPGVKGEDVSKRDLSDLLDEQKRNILWPVTDPRVPQKNLDWIKQHQRWFEQNNINLIVPSSADIQLPFVSAVGGMPREDLFALYRHVEGVLIVSTEETLCLPIFEAASVEAPVWVLRKPYIEAIQKWRGLPPQVTIFEDVNDISFAGKKPTKQENLPQEYYEADWQIY